MIVCCCSPLSLGVLLFFLHVSPIRCLFVNTISHSKVLLFAFFSRTDVSFSNDVGKVEHPSLNDDRWRNKKNNVHIPGTSNVVGRSSGFFFGNPKRLIFRDTLEIWVARRLQVGFTPPPQRMQKKRQDDGFTFWNPKTKPWGRPFSRYDVSQGFPPKLQYPP